LRNLLSLSVVAIVGTLLFSLGGHVFVESHMVLEPCASNVKHNENDEVAVESETEGEVAIPEHEEELLFLRESSKEAADSADN